MCAEAIVEISANGSKIPTEKEIKSTYLKRWDRKYGATYAVLDILQRISIATTRLRSLRGNVR